MFSAGAGLVALNIARNDIANQQRRRSFGSSQPRPIVPPHSKLDPHFQMSTSPPLSSPPQYHNLYEQEESCVFWDQKKMMKMFG